MKKDPIALHPDRKLRGVVRLPKSAVLATKCSLFSDGRHRIKISPAGVRTACLCGALR